MSSNLPQLSTLSGQTVDRKRKTADTYVAGRHVAGAETLTTGILASVQPPSSKYFNMMSSPIEGKRVKEWIVVFCALDTFREADDRTSTPADIVVYEGNDYEIYEVTPRRGRHLNHDKVLAVRFED